MNQTMQCFHLFVNHFRLAIFDWMPLHQKKSHPKVSNLCLLGRIIRLFGIFTHLNIIFVICNSHDSLKINQILYWNEPQHKLFNPNLKEKRIIDQIQIRCVCYCVEIRNSMENCCFCCFLSSSLLKIVLVTIILYCILQ